MIKISYDQVFLQLSSVLLIVYYSNKKDIPFGTIFFLTNMAHWLPIITGQNLLTHSSSVLLDRKDSSP